MTWLLTRLRAIFRQDAYPYERRVCLWAWAIRTGLQTCALTAMAWWWASVLWPAFPLRPGWLVTELETPRMFLIPWGALTLWGAAALANFAWADLRLEEWWRELWIGCSVAPSIFPTSTLEAFNGHKRGGYVDDDFLEATWNYDKFRPLALWQGQPGSGRFDVLQLSDVTWAVRLHHRFVRPWARRRGWVVG